MLLSLTCPSCFSFTTGHLTEEGCPVCGYSEIRCEARCNHAEARDFVYRASLDESRMVAEETGFTIKIWD